MKKLLILSYLLFSVNTSYATIAGIDYNITSEPTLSQTEIKPVIDDKENLKTIRELMKKEEAKIEREKKVDTGFVSLFLGTWGIMSYAILGGNVYPLAVGGLFLYNSYTNIKGAIVE